MNSARSERKVRSISIFNLFLCLAASNVFAQGRPPETIYKTDWNERLNPNVGLKAHDEGLLDDKIDFSTGRLSFETVDVSLPGNSALIVEIRRRRNPSQATFNEFTDWQLAVPSVSTKIPQSEFVSGRRWGKTRCSASLSSSIPNSTFAPGNAVNSNPVLPSKYSDGVLLDVPGVSSSHLLDKTITASWPAAAQKVTADGWYFTCIPNIDGSGTEGFTGRAPNGDRYTFNVMKWRKFVSYDDAWVITYDSVNGNRSNFGQNWYFYDTLAVSQVTDVNGNWVNYTYDSLGRLTTIAANDGRQININYLDSTSNYIASVVANPGTAAQRQWTYQYGSSPVTQYAPPASADGVATVTTGSVYTLSSVTLPNGRQWLYSLAGLTVQSVAGTSYSAKPGGQLVNCVQQNQTVSVTHPDGVVGTFVLQERPAMIAFNGLSGPEGPPCPNSSLGRSSTPITADVMAVTSKSLAVPGMSTSTWSYTYTRGDAPGGDGTNKATINLPDGTKQIKSFSLPSTYSAILKEETFPTVSSATPLETISYTYAFVGAAGSDFVASNTQEVYTPLRQQLVTIARGSDWYKNQNTYITDRTASNYSWGFPTNISQWSSLGGGTRSADIVYSNDQTNWILGLPSTVTKNGKLFDSYAYDTSGRLTTHQRFGVTMATLAYYTSGAQAGLLNWVRDALSHQTTFSNWYRGSPQAITRPDNSNVSYSIDENGWVKSKTDALNASTSYSYDGIGRLTQITPPAGWNATTISYSYSGGYLYQTATQGPAQTTTTYNAMLWPVQVLAQSLSGGGGNIYTNSSYDPLGRMTFASLPSATAGSSIGTLSSYDALGRVTQRQETASGGGTTSVAYLAGNATQTTDPSGNATTTTKSGFGSPDDGDVIQVTKPNGVSATYGFDIYGNLLSLTQAKGDGTNVVSTFAYDGRNRMCRRQLPEVGDVLYAYDDANQMSGYAEGQPGGTGCATLPTTSVSLSYDAAGRPLSTTYPGTTPAISRSYDLNGNLLTINRGGVNWTYSYNSINLISSETLTLDGRTYQTTYAYNGNAALGGQTFPSGRPYAYGLDGYGRLTSITSGATNYIQNVSYFPNGKISQLTRGNGGTYQQSLNARQLVSSVGGNWGTNLSYAYDLNGRVLQITSPNSIYNRTFGYDGAGRLTSASGVWGSGGYTYDALNNMTQAVLGSRIIDIQYIGNKVSQVRDSAASSSWRGYVYDAPGNVVADGKHNFTYDSANQPISISGNDTGNYTYDGNLKRVKEVVGGQTIYSVYSRSGALLTRDNVSNGKRTDYLNVAGQTFVRDTGGVVAYPLNDALGTAYMVADANGNLTATYNYTPFGESIGTGPGVSGEQGYTGHIEDKTGLIYMQARYFDPTIGRFLSPDPIGYEDQLNLYAYVGNDPLNRTDPSGRFSKTIFFRFAALAGEEEVLGGGPLDLIADALAIGTIVVGISVAAVAHDESIKADSNKERVEATDKAEGIDRTSNSKSDATKDSDKVGSLPKPPSGPGKVPKDDRDPKRVWTPSERAAKRDAQGGQCATGCGTNIDASNSRGHHIVRHADGGQTVDENHAEVCLHCHDQLH